MRKLLVALVLCFSLIAGAQQLPDAPKPKPSSKIEAIKFGGATVFFAGSAVFQVIAQHHGAQLCKIETERDGQVWTGTTDGQGHRPDNADRREAYILGGVYGGALVLELTKHHTAAKRILIYGGAINYGIAGATYWAGCN